jgi:hypothetical protein
VEIPVVVLSDDAACHHPDGCRDARGKGARETRTVPCDKPHHIPGPQHGHIALISARLPPGYARQWRWRGRGPCRARP